jgi:hypothetical protein
VEKIIETFGNEEVRMRFHKENSEWSGYSLAVAFCRHVRLLSIGIARRLFQDISRV